MLALLLFALVAPALQHAADQRWQQVTLFDWVYPSEQAYADLKQAAIEAQAQGWVVERIRRGEALPQASAREMAWQLQKNGSVGPDLKAKLATAFSDEPALVGGGDGNASGVSRAAAVAAALDRASARMDALEASMKANHYGKGSTPAVNLDIFNGYRLDAPAGLNLNDNHAFYFGGITATLMGTLDKINFTVGIGGNYTNAVGGSTSSGISGNGYADMQARNATFNTGASFQMPLGEGGLDVSLGEIKDTILSPLLFSSVLPPVRDSFFVDVSTSYRMPKLIKTMELGYPAGTRQDLGVLVKRQGSSFFWPFTSTQFAYAPARQYWETWNAKLTTWALRLDEDLGPRGSWLDGLLIYGLMGGSFTDRDAFRGSGMPMTYDQSTQTSSLGTEVRFSSGSTLRFDGAMSNYSVKKVTLPTYDMEFSGVAWIATLIQPVGPLYFAFEGAAADPKFLSAPRVGDRVQAGSTFDSLAQQEVFPGAAATDLAWISLVKDPAVLVNNTQRYTLKGEWHGSWVSLGLYEGIVSQVNPTGPWVMTSPSLQGRAENGYGWWKIFGQSYGLPPAPGSTTATVPGVAAQGAYNLPTDGTTANAKSAIYNSAGSATPVHWQQISQLSYRAVEFSLLLTEKGVGDRHILPDSIKALNYAGGNLQFDLASLFGRGLPLDLNIVGEVRDLAAQAGVPALDDANLFNQQVVQAFLSIGITETLSFVAMGGYETWRSKQSYYPLNIVSREAGAGADLNLDPLLTGLKLNFRASAFNHEDLNIGSRQMSLLTLSLGSTLTY